MKKMLSMLMALLLMAAPLSGLADTLMNAPDYGTLAIEAGRRVSATITLSDVATDFTGEPAVDQVIADVLGALVITCYQQGDEIYYAIGMKQESGVVADLLTMGVAVAGEDAYILSNLIGGTIVIGADEVVPVLERLIDMFVMLGFIEEEQAKQIKAELPAIWEVVCDEFAASMESALTPEDLADMDFSALMGIVETVAGKMSAGDVEPLARNCDPAVSMITLTLTPEEMNSILAAGVRFIKDNPKFADAIAKDMDFDNVYAAEFSGVSGEPMDFYGWLDTLIEGLNTEQVFAEDTIVRIWLGEDGMPVAMDCKVCPMNEEKAVEVSLTYGRLTLNDGVAHTGMLSFPGGDVTVDVLVKGDDFTVNVAVAEEGETRVAMTLDWNDRSAENLLAADIIMDLTVTEADVSVNGYYYAGDERSDYTQTTEDATVNVRIGMTTDAVLDGVDFTETSKITIAVNGKHYLSINSVGGTSMAGDSIMTGDVVRPAELSDSEFANWFVSAYSALFSGMQNMIYCMPASLINLMNTGF